MKTAISLPDEIFNRASQRANDLGLDAHSVTRQIDAALRAVGGREDSAHVAVPGNVFLPTTATGLPRDSVLNVTALATLNTTDLGDCVDVLPENLLHEVDRGLRRVLAL